MPLVPAPNLTGRFSQLIVAAVLVSGLAWLHFSSFGAPRLLHLPGLGDSTHGSSSASTGKKTVLPLPANHPIEYLIGQGERELQALLLKETKDVRSAVDVYRERRGRQPPPGFEAWFNFAREHDAVIVEVFFDQIYTDLAPFWGIAAKEIREQANDFIHRISVRNGKVTQRTDIDERPWMNLWQDLVQTIGQHLPDVDLAINVMDESRLVVPWEEINGYMEKEQASRQVVPKAELKRYLTSVAYLDYQSPPQFDPAFIGSGQFWPLAVAGCPPESPARSAYIESTFTSLPPLPIGYPDHSYKGYVSNWTVTKSPCDNPTLQGLHGTFVKPLSISTSKKLFPLFSSSKLPMNNDILLPPAMYWTIDPFHSGGGEHGPAWEKKKDSLIWRDAASGGLNNAENWTRFQRHRFVSMVNGTSVRLAQKTNGTSRNFIIPSHASYDLSLQQPGGDLGEWVSSWSDAAFVHLLCFPEEPPGSKTCAYTDAYYSVKKPLSVAELYMYKYLPDIDGNRFSGRYRGFLGSTSLPIKATIYNEWHDSRLVPWVHFVPMDNTFADIYGIMEYFVGNAQAGIAGRDERAKAIAMEGKRWAEKVLRREDMQIYVFRLILEYARLCDDKRDVLGWAGDAA